MKVLHSARRAMKNHHTVVRTFCAENGLRRIGPEHARSIGLKPWTYHHGPGKGMWFVRNDAPQTAG
jgi:hypothetical protein